MASNQIKFIERGLYRYGKKFYARYNGKHLGTFSTLDLARVAYRHARSSIRRGRSPKKTFSHIVIPPLLIRKGDDLSHVESLAYFIAKRKPSAIICLGNWWGLNSLYNIPSEEVNYENVMAELRHGNLAMKKFLSILEEAIDNSTWLPQQIFFYGSREAELNRVKREKPSFRELLTIEALDLYGWIIPDYLEPYVLDGILYAHRFYDFINQVPLEGNYQELISMFEMSFVHSGESEFSFGFHPNSAEILKQGLSGGRYNKWDQSGFQGIYCLNNVFKGRYDLETVSLNSIISGKVRS